MTKLHPYRLVYSNETKRYSNPKGVKVTAAEFGSTSSVEYLDLMKQFPYFNVFVDYFAERGYTRDLNIRAAPYDWRLSPGK